MNWLAAAKNRLSVEKKLCAVDKKSCANREKSYDQPLSQGLNFTDEYIADINRCFQKSAKARVEAALAEAAALDSHRAAEEARRHANQVYAQFLAGEQKSLAH